MRILLADDEPLARKLVAGVLEPEGHEVLQAASGEEALELFRRKLPDIVLTDVHMPGMSGLDLCRAIRTSSEGRYVPVVMITGSEHRPELIQESLEAGAVEFLTKPLIPQELRCRMGALVELAQLHNDVLHQKSMWVEEAAVLKHIMDRYVEAGRRQMPGTFTMDTLWTERINGDICVYRQGLPGIHCGMIVDATGHGLTAGVSTMPVVEAFLSMVGKDIPLETVYVEVNAKLRRILPTGRFACLLMWRVDTFQETITVLNAGMPPAYLATLDGGLRTFESRHMPAGIDDSVKVVVAEECAVAVGDRFFALSDGLLDIFTPEEIVSTLIEEGRSQDFEAHRRLVETSVGARVADAEWHDDISWALWQIPPAVFGTEPGNGAEELDPATLVPGLKVRYQVNPRVLSFRELVPNLLGLLAGLGVRQSDTQVLALLIFEAVANALDHGLLLLDSRLKEHSFEDFENQRRERLALLMDGQIDVVMSLFHEPGPRAAIRRIHVEVQDSGPGFDWRSFLASQAADPLKPHGRGLTLIQAMARDVRFNEAGNRIGFSMPCL